MSDGRDGSQTTDPHEAFHLFGHELRLDILLALNDAEDYSLAFAELQSEVNERDSGKFSYHLSKLEGLFVEKVGDQYVLKHPGHRVIDASSGAFQDSPDVGPLEVAGACPDCGGTPVFSYADHLGTVACEMCGTKLVEYPIDPGAFYNRPVDGGVDAFDRWVKATWRMASDGICFACAGHVRVSFAETAEGPEHSDRYPHQVAIPNAHAAFENGQLIDESLAGRIEALGRELVDYAGVESYPETTAACAVPTAD